VAIVGVALAAFYAIRLFQRTMHGRPPHNVDSREIGLRDAAVLVPLVACIVALALYPGLILSRGEAAVENTVAAVTSTPEPAASGVPAAVTRRGWSGWTAYAPLPESDR
jgi:NADH-quinone oxidoreductase subunit M